MLTMYRNPSFGYASYADAGGAGAGGDSLLASGYWKGPGGWVYRVDGLSVTVVWSPISRAIINKPQDASASSKILAELRSSKDAAPYSSQEAAIAAAKGTLPAKSTRAPSPSPSGDPTVPPAVAGTPFYKSPWVIGGTAVVFLGAIAAIVFWPKKK